ncbi:hypothetical protein ABK040_001141 [Willaertia magna]
MFGASTEFITRRELINQLEKIGYSDIPDDIIRDFIEELKKQNITVIDDQPHYNIIGNDSEEECQSEFESTLERSDYFTGDHEEEESHIPHHISALEEEIENDILSMTSESSRSFVSNISKKSAIEEVKEKSLKSLSPRSKPLNHSKSATNSEKKKIRSQLSNSFDDDGEDTPKIFPPIEYNDSFRNEEDNASDIEVVDDANEQEEEEEGYDTTTYYSKHYETEGDESNNKKTTNIPKLQNIPSSSIEINSVKKSIEVDRRKEPLSAKNYTPPTLSQRNPPRPKTAPVQKEIPPKVSKENTSKISGEQSLNDSIVSSTSSTTSSRRSASPRPTYKANTRKPVTYRKKVNDPVKRWQEMNSVWKNDKFLSHQENQQKSHRWRVRQEMRVIQGDSFLA